MTNEEKSKKIAERLGLHWHEFKGNKDWGGNEFCFKCETSILLCQANPDFFSPDGQQKLAGALLEKVNHKITVAFASWFNENYFTDLKFGLHNHMTKKDLFIMQILLEINKETKLAEMFFEFLESEGL